ncbi:hypothetical protein WN944_012029 [Citrus x changshan-huyou]|uniref:Uncharacterized protein n=1 Tax=Citrus x changshan-huyou TaxID=2935761 RepID=A0AAP0MWS6_9ROSI
MRILQSFPVLKPLQGFKLPQWTTEEAKKKRVPALPWMRSPIEMNPLEDYPL